MVVNLDHGFLAGGDLQPARTSMPLVRGGERLTTSVKGRIQVVWRPCMASRRAVPIAWVMRHEGGMRGEMSREIGQAGAAIPAGTHPRFDDGYPECVEPGS